MLYDDEQAQYALWNTPASGIQSLCDAFTRQARIPFRAASVYLNSTNENVVFSARAVITFCEELSIRPLLDADLSHATPDTRAFAIRAVRDAELELRRRTIAWLEHLLGDTARLPAPTMRTEERMPAMRVCDEAFLALRQLVYFGEDPDAQDDDALRFLDQSFAHRDAMIARAKASRAYRRALGEFVNNADE